MAKKSNNSDWMKLQAGVKRNDKAADGFTTKDAAKGLGITITMARNRIRQALDSGEIVRVGTRQEESISGRPFNVTVFAAKKKK